MRATIRFALLAFLLGLLTFLKEPDTTLFWQALYDVGHAFLFAGVIVIVRGLPGVNGNGLALLITLALAVGSELLQLAQPGRDASIDDVLRDAAGAVAVVLLLASSARSRGSARGSFSVSAGSLRVAAGAILLAVAVPFLMVCAAYVERQRAFPTLFRMDGSWWERRLITAGTTTVIWPDPSVVPPSRAVLLLRPATYSGVTFDEPFPDWAGFHRLVFNVTSFADQTLRLTVRVHDRTHNQQFDDRFNRRLAVVPGENHVSISLEDIRVAPARREMDMHHVRGIVLFIRDLERPVRLQIGPLVLE